MRNISFLVFIMLSIYSNAQEIEFFPSFDGAQIAYTDEGQGPPVILLHGFINTGSSWNKTVLRASLIEAGYRIITPDLRGNGYSDKPQNPEAYQNNAEVKDLMALTKYLQLPAYQVVAYSRGSIILAKWLTMNNNISQAVIGGMGLDFSDPHWKRRIQFAEAFSGTTPLTSETEGAVQYAKSIGADIKVLGYLQEYQPVTTPTELKKITTKIRIVCGDQDKDNGSPNALQRHLPNSELVIIPGDHNTTYRKRAFSDVVMEFLKRE